MADPTRRSTRFSMRSKQIGQLLLENGDVKAEQIAQALKTQEQQGGLLGQILQRMGVCSAQAISAALLKQVQVTDVKCDDLAVPPEVSELVPQELCEAEKLCPFERLGGLLCVVMGNPLNRRAISQIEEKARLKVKSFKSVWPKISELIQRSYGAGGGAAEMEAIPAADAAAALGASPVAEAVPAADAGVPPSMEALEAGLPQVVPGDPDAAMQAPQQTFLPSLPGSRRARVVEAPAEPTIEGIDTLTDGHVAEIVETAKKGARPRKPDEAPAKPKVQKQAKVNIDLDALDFSQ
ncbi:MAG: hypothetical protein NTW87_14225, partial [Planctomycetota bacterium]|nr:hypothetical protein [Planctomycetota bacterium]